MFIRQRQDMNLDFLISQIFLRNTVLRYELQLHAVATLRIIEKLCCHYYVKINIPMKNVESLVEDHSLKLILLN